MWIYADVFVDCGFGEIQKNLFFFDIFVKIFIKNIKKFKVVVEAVCKCQKNIKKQSKKTCIKIFIILE